MSEAPSSLSLLCIQVADNAARIASECCAYCTFSRKMGGAVLDALRHPRRISWRSVAYYMDSCGSDAMPIISLLGFLIGVILAFQAIVQLGRFGVEGYVVNLVGTVISTELAPLVTAIVLAGRTGSNFAAELGSMKGSEEIDALVTMGFDVRRFLLTPKLLAMIVITPGLTIICDVCGIFGGMAIVCNMVNTSAAEYMGRTFEVIQPVDLAQGIVKSFVFAAIVATVGCMKGLNAERDAQGVGRSATSAVVTSIFLIVVTDAIMTALFSTIS
ncbi:MAG: ABC transporter permease [Victivallaceae bacterium]|nr:ABC transporter permease [Victivallaceae bacterium]